MQLAKMSLAAIPSYGGWLPSDGWIGPSVKSLNYFSFFRLIGVSVVFGHRNLHCIHECHSRLFFVLSPVLSLSRTSLSLSLC